MIYIWLFTATAWSYGAGQEPESESRLVYYFCFKNGRIRTRSMATTTPLSKAKILKKEQLAITKPNVPHPSSNPPPS